MGLAAARPPAPRLDRRVGRENVGDATGEDSRCAAAAHEDETSTARAMPS